jgi:hypothetical protein
MKPIKLDESIKQKAYELLADILNDYKGDEDFNIKITPDVLLTNDNNIQKPIVYLTAQTYVKIQKLIDASSDELAWHGTVTKLDNAYLIDDIFVYPQTVTSVTVDSDEEAYAKWLMELDDNIINHLRFQGHSHVNMGVTPSGRDTGNWHAFLNLLKDDEFYIFCIANKKDQFYWTIYDMKTNIIFENKDIEMVVIDADCLSIKDWVKENIQTYIKRQPITANARQGFANNSANTPAVNPSSYILVDDDRPSAVQSTVFDKWIPDRLRAAAGLIDISYDPDTDTYYADGFVPGFVYNSAWGSYTMEGFNCRTRYGAPAIHNASKEIKKTNGKRGRPSKK